MENHKGFGQVRVRLFHKECSKKVDQSGQTKNRCVDKKLQIPSIVMCRGGRRGLRNKEIRRVIIKGRSKMNLSLGD